MKQQEVFKKIGVLIKDLNEQYDYLASTGEALNEVELELFVANTHFIADHAEILRKLLAQSARMQRVLPEATTAATSHNGISKERYFEPVVRPLPSETINLPESTQTAQQQPRPVAEPAMELEVPKQQIRPAQPASIDQAANPNEDTNSYIKPEPEMIRHELTLDDLGDWDEDDEEPIDEPAPPAPVAAEAEPVPAPPAVTYPPVDESPKVTIFAKPVAPPPVAEAPRVEPKEPQQAVKEEEHIKTFNERISEQLHAGARVSDSLGSNAVTDLKAAITLNQKLLFIKDLFNGYSLAYNEAIDLVNRCSSFDEADQFLKTHYSAKNKWDEKQSTAEKFYEILHRRFGGN